MRRLVDVIRLLHPGPTTLNAIAAFALSTVAGADAPRALGAALVMLGAHGFIGALNDVVDRSVDRARPEKAIAAQRISVGAGALVAAISATIGAAAAAALGTSTLAIAIVGMCLGAAYDLGLKRSALSWLPFSLGVALIPPFAWAAAEAPLPTTIAWLSAAAICGGAALALQNGLADRALDSAAGSRGVAVRLGESRVILFAALLHVGAFALVESARAASPRWRGADVDPLALFGGILQAMSLALSASGSPWLRRRGWEVGGVALLLLALAVALGGLSE